MIGAIIGLIFVLIVAGCIYWAIQQFLPLIPMAEPFRTAVNVLMVLLLVVVVLWIIAVLLGLVGIHVPYVGRVGVNPILMVRGFASDRNCPGLGFATG
jgi:hypothetical protein